MKITKIKSKHESQSEDKRYCRSHLTCGEVDELIKSHGELLEACKESKSKRSEALEIMKRHGIKIDDQTEIMQKFALTLYTMLVGIYTDCEHAITNAE